MQFGSFLLGIYCWLGTLQAESDVGDSSYDYCHHPDCSLAHQHVMCGTAGRVSSRLFAAGVTQWMRHQLLLLHNRYRDNVAMGLEAGQPPAANMRKMYWDHELETMAARWAHQCQKRHDECRNTLRFNVLQNIDVRPVMPRMTEAQLLADAVASWFSGARQLAPESVFAFKLSNCSAEGGCNAHWYSAAVWGSTWRLGCSQAICTLQRHSCIGYRSRRSTRTDANATTATTMPTTSESHVRRERWAAHSAEERSFEKLHHDVMMKSPLHRGVKEAKNPPNERGYIAYTVCNYGPAGNIEGFPMYHVGTHCTNCPQGTSCDDSNHRGLCSLLGDPDTNAELPAADY